MNKKMPTICFSQMEIKLIKRNKIQKKNNPKTQLNTENSQPVGAKLCR